MKKRIILVAAATAVLAAGTAHAEEGTKGGLGFRSRPIPIAGFAAAPFQAVPSIGGRQWFTDQIGLDVGFGYNQAEVKPLPQKWTGYVVDVGVPLSLKWVSDRVNLIFRPSFQWARIEDKLETPPASAINYTGIGGSGEIEVEWMVAERLSVSASHGVSYMRIEDDASPKSTLTVFGTTQGNFTELGFHVYLW